MTQEPPSENHKWADFIGRKEDLEKLGKLLEPESRPWTIVLSGQGGMGKTALLTQALAQLKAEQKCDSVVFIDLFHKSYDEMIREIGTKLLPSEQSAYEQFISDYKRAILEEQINGVLSARRVILALDTAESVRTEEDARQIRTFLETLPAPSKAVITTRHSPGIRGQVEVRISGLDLENTREMIRVEAERIGISDKVVSDATLQQRIWRVTGGMPLAIKWLLSLIAHTHLDLATALDTYSEVLLDGETNVLESVFSRSWSLLDRQSQQILILIALDEQPISSTEVATSLGLGVSETALLLKHLQDLSLLESTGSTSNPTVSVHSLTRRFVRALLTRESVDGALTGTLMTQQAERVLRDFLRLRPAIGRSSGEHMEKARQFLDSLACLLELEPVGIGRMYRMLEGFFLETRPLFPTLDALWRVPIVYFPEPSVRRRDIESAKHLVGVLLHSPKRIALLVTHAQGRDLVKARQLVEEERRSVYYRFDFVLVTAEEVRRIALSADPAGFLRRLIVSQIDLVSASPFVINGPAPESVFFGREDVFRQIAENLSSSSFVITGGRRIGKTSVLGKLHRSRLPSLGVRTLYHDCSSTPSYEEFMAASVWDWFPNSPTQTPVTFEELLHLPLRDKPLVLLLDEADKLVPNDRGRGWPLFSKLRAFSNSGNGRIILCCERVLREALREPASPLFNFADEILLGPLSYRATRELIEDPFRELGITLDNPDLITNTIYDFTSGHPNIVQRLCRRLVEQVNQQSKRQISEQDVSVVIADPKFQEEDFLGTYWERATPLEQIISLLMTLDARPYRLRDVLDLLTAHGLRPEPEIVKTALDRLADLRNILKRTQAGYEFAVTAFPRVIANTTTAEDLLIVFKSQYLKNPMELPE